MMERRKTRGEEHERLKAGEGQEVGRRSWNVTRSFLVCVFALTLLVLAGCNSAYTANRIQYLLEPARNAEAPAAEQAVAGGGAISVQVLNELTNVARRKMHNFKSRCVLLLILTTTCMNSSSAKPTPARLSGNTLGSTPSV